MTVYFEHAPAVKDLEIVAYGCSYYTVENGPAGGVDGFEVDQKSCTLDIPTNYPTVYVKAHAKYGNYVNCGTDNSSTCVQINNEQWGPYTDWHSVTVFTPTTTTTTTTTVPQGSDENTDTSTTTSSTTSTSTTSTTTTTLPPSNTTTTTTTIPDNCYETKLAEFRQSNPALYGQIGGPSFWDSNNGQPAYQVGDYWNGNLVVEAYGSASNNAGIRYEYNSELYESTIAEWANNSC